MSAKQTMLPWDILRGMGEAPLGKGNQEWHGIQSELHFAAALAEAAAVVNSSLDFDQVLDRILEQVSRVVPADTYNIMLVQDGIGHIVRWRGYESLGISDTQVTKAKTPVTTYATFRKMIDTGDPVVVSDTLANESWIVTPQRVDHRSYVGAPIRVSDRTEGFINVNSAHSGQFTHRDAERLRAFADHAAIALRNAELYLEVQQHADQLERRVAERTEALRARTAWSEAILHSTSDGIVVTDAEGNIIQTNPIAAEWLEQSLRPGDAARLRATIKQIAQSTDTAAERLLALTGIDLELRASPAFRGSEDQDVVVIAVHDVTHLRALDRMKSQFISDVSHELRTPVASLRLYASLIKGSTGERQQQYFDSLDEELDRITRLVEGILQIARLEAGRVELQTQVLDLNLLVNTAASSYAGAAEKKGLTIDCHTQSDTVFVSADPAWLIRAIDNLIENALMYTDDGSIALATDTVTLNGRALGRLRVIDTGIGIPEEELPQVFTRFFRGDQARTRQIPGSGLGLTIVKGILDAHGGEVEVASSPGKGTEIAVLIPLASPEN